LIQSESVSLSFSLSEAVHREREREKERKREREKERKRERRREREREGEKEREKERGEREREREKREEHRERDTAMGNVVQCRVHIPRTSQRYMPNHMSISNHDPGGYDGVLGSNLRQRIGIFESAVRFMPLSWRSAHASHGKDY
jgi:hypothetical protein